MKCFINSLDVFVFVTPADVLRVSIETETSPEGVEGIATVSVTDPISGDSAAPALFLFLTFPIE